jgi:hypothetical protein
VRAPVHLLVCVCVRAPVHLQVMMASLEAMRSFCR